MSDHEELRLLRALDALPRAIQPQRDLWPGIAHALQAEAYAKPRLHSGVRRLALAASLLLMLGTSLYYGLRQPNPAFDHGELDTLIAALQSRQATSKAALLVQYRGQNAAYADWQTQMQELESAEDAIYRALRQDPGNLALFTLLRQVQDKQLKLIDAVFSPRFTTL
ncbi:MAG: hypothetical protein LBF16_04865 [Pseudomonadales bacterium]|jgi:hypothetical protein|nr:hypothetical protein [Pseudomonadales bacterium]